jgi:hypothetical protein
MGGYHMLMSDWGAIMTPQKATLDSMAHAYTFLIRIPSTSLISVSIFSVCCYSSVSISMAVDYHCSGENRGGRPEGDSPAPGVPQPGRLRLQVQPQKVLRAALPSHQGTGGLPPFY